MTPSPKGIAVVTGASSGIGAIYADRLAQRGYDLMLVARNEARLSETAQRLAAATGRSVQTVRADLNDQTDLRQLEALLRRKSGITLLVNNAGVGATAPLLESDRVLDLIRGLPSGPAACEPHQRPHTCQHLTALCSDPEDFSCVSRGVHTCRKVVAFTPL